MLEHQNLRKWNPNSKKLSFFACESYVVSTHSVCWGLSSSVCVCGEWVVWLSGWTWKLIALVGTSNHSPDMVKSAVLQKCIPARSESSAGSTTIRFSCTPVALAQHSRSGGASGKEHTSVVLKWPDQTQMWAFVENEQFFQCQDESGWWARSPVLALHYAGLLCVCFVCVSCSVGVLGPVCMSVFLMQSKQMDQLKLTSVHSALYACKHLQSLKSLENVNLCFM